MAAENTLKVIVQSQMQRYDFTAIVHRAEHPSEQKIEPEFYIRWAGAKEGEGKVHEGVHYELELTVSPAFERVHPDVPLHAHKNPTTGIYYVCYTGQVKTFEHARDLFHEWCVGTAFAIEQSRDFAPINSEHPDDFLEYMARHHRFELVE